MKNIVEKGAVYKEVKEARERSNFSIKEFSEVIGVSPSTISQVECRKYEPSINLMDKLKALYIIGRSVYYENDWNIAKRTFVDCMTAGISTLKIFNKLETSKLAKNFIDYTLLIEIVNLCIINNVEIV